MPDVLTDSEVRVLGALVEKELSTPEYYPLTLNALIAACNQKSNRDPVVAYDDYIVTEAVDGLREKGLVRVVLGERANRYMHYFDEMYALTPQEKAILCELMLRGPQTVGELRGRTERLNNTQTLAEVEETIETLCNRPEPLVMRLPRQAGRKESRFAHLLSGEPAIPEETAPRQDAPVTGHNRIAQLEDEVRQLREGLEELRQQFAEFTQQFE